MSHRLSRKTSGRALIPEIDGLRSLAIVSVVLFHANETFRMSMGFQPLGFGYQVERWLISGQYGVPLFFVISGFILALPFAQAMTGGKPVSLVRYVVRRITRLEPPYIIALLALFGVYAMQTGRLDELPRVLASAFYLHNVIYREPSQVMTVAWSLEVEVQFYLIMPALAMVFLIRSAWLRRGLLCAGIAACSWFFGTLEPIWGRTVMHHGGYFLAGLLLADVYLAGWLSVKPAERGTRPTASQLVWDVLAIASLFIVFKVKVFRWHPEVVAPWLIFIGYAAVFRSGYVRRFFRWTPVVILGGMCYSIYLWHFFILISFWPLWHSVVGPSHNGLHLVLFIAVAAPLSILGGAITFVLIERPTMDPKWPQKLWALASRPFASGRTTSA